MDAGLPGLPTALLREHGNDPLDHDTSESTVEDENDSWSLDVSPAELADLVSWLGEVHGS